MAIGDFIEIYAGTEDDGLPIVLSYRETDTYFLFGNRPKLVFRSTKSEVKLKGEQVTNLDAKEEPTNLKGKWLKYSPNLGEKKSTYVGRTTLELNDGEYCINCYLLPKEIVSCDQVLCMIRDMESELGPIAIWSSEFSDLRADSTSIEGDTETTRTSELLKKIHEEYLSARALSRDPYTEIGPDGLLTQAVPENNIIKYWSIKRAGDLHNEIRLLDQSRDDINLRMARNLPRERLIEYQSRLENILKVREDTSDLSVRVATYSRAQATHFDLTPAMQRDYRLRRLFRAFAPSVSEQLTFNSQDVSTLPPVTLNKIFELWCFITISRWLKLMGYEVSFVNPQRDKTDLSLLHVSISLVLKNVMLVLDFEPDPRRIRDIPLPESRSTSAKLWAGGNKCDNDDLFAVINQCSPDITIRVYGPSGHALAVGDATLSNPKYYDKGKPAGTKTEKLNDYRNALGWFIDGKTVSCHPAGAFLMYPGPKERWHKLGKALSAYDYYLLCPTPMHIPEAPPQEFQHMIGRLVAEVN